MAKKKQATALSQDAITALRGSSFEGSSFALPEGHLECYSEIKDLMAAIGGKWASKKRRMIFADGVDCKAMVLAACDRGEIPPSNPLDFFPTPPDIVGEVVSSSWLTERWPARITVAEMDDRPVRYLEPSGGTGAFADVMAEKMRPQDELVICELNPLLASMLRTRFPQAKVVEGDFLDFTDPGQFDVILMNPPFDGKAYRKHVEHATKMLRKLGVLVSIVPSSFVYHGDEFLHDILCRGEWQDLGGDRFEGTNYATTAVFIENDPDAGWREKPFEGYTTHHAWDAAMSVSNDGIMLAALGKAADFDEAVRILKGWSSQMLRSGACSRMDEAIVREVLDSLARDYVHENLARLTGMLAPVPVTAQKKKKVVAVEAEAMQFSLAL